MSWFPSLELFYAEDDRRRKSGEVDFGVMWRDGQRWPQYRVSWVRTTGEVYAYNQARGTVLVLGVVEDPDSSSGRNPRIEQALDGWTDHVNMLDGLSWVRDRLSLVERTQP